MNMNEYTKVNVNIKKKCVVNMRKLDCVVLWLQVLNVSGHHTNKYLTTREEDRFLYKDVISECFHIIII